MRLPRGKRVGATRRGASGVLLQLRLVFYGVLIGLMMPANRQIDWSALVPASAAVAAPTVRAGEKPVSARFTICGRAKRIDCVVDGDTFWMAGTKIRIADIDTPETHPPRCAAEARAGRAATLKMQALLNAGPFTLVPIRRDVDRYGRKLRIVQRNGESLGGMLVQADLARHYGGGKRAGWCDGRQTR